MSSSRLKPAVTPLIALASNARTRPWSARTAGSSPRRVTTTCSPSTATEMPSGTGWCSVPFGPFTCTVPSETVTWTALGMGMGCFPMRDITASLPDAAHDFTAQAHLTRAGVAHEPLGGRNHRDPDAAAHLGQLLDAPVDPKSGTRDPLQAVDRWL